MSLINQDYARNYLLRDAKWSESHGATADSLGAGMLYYALAYSLNARVCVCLGSGGGFVPRMMAQAQLDRHNNGRTILVDADIGPWGRPDWVREGSFFRTTFPMIEVVQTLTKDAASLFLSSGLKIDYLHIDADHSEEGTLADLQDYLPMVREQGVVTLHDTVSVVDPSGTHPPSGVLRAIQRFVYGENMSVVDFPMIGAGVAVLRKGRVV